MAFKSDPRHAQSTPRLTTAHLDGMVGALLWRAVAAFLTPHRVCSEVVVTPDCFHGLSNSLFAAVRRSPPVVVAADPGRLGVGGDAAHGQICFD